MFRFHNLDAIFVRRNGSNLVGQEKSGYYLGFGRILECFCINKLVNAKLV